MTRALLGLVLCALGGAVLAQKPGDVYSPAGGKFAVRFPGNPKESTQTTKSPLGELKVFTATYATSDGNAFMVSYTDFPEGTAGADSRNTLYDGVRDGLMGKDGKKVSEKEREIGPDKLPGRDIVIERDKGKQQMRFRVVLHEGRLFQVAVIGTPKFVEGKDAVGFVESFEITK